MTYKPKTIDELQQWLDTKDPKEKLRGEDASDILATMFDEISDLLFIALHTNQKAKNYLTFHFASEETPDYDFDLVLLKKGRHYPPRNLGEKLENAGVKINE